MKTTRGRFRPLATRVLSVIAIAACATTTQAQKLTIQGDKFAVDGTPRFLTFITYFGAMGAPHFAQDLHFIRKLGFDGVRIWPNLDTGPQLMNADGSLQSDNLALLRSILDAARVEHLIVDVTFTYEHIPGMTPATAKVGILAATTALRTYENVLFDIQNERNVRDRRFMSEADVASIYAGIKSIDPARIASASNAPMDDDQGAADFTARLGLDANMYHDPRSPRWYQFPTMDAMLQKLKSAGKPVYLQEPMTTRDNLFPYPAHDRAEYFLEAIANAKLTGAAAWCFHTEVAVDYRDGGPAYIEDRIRAYDEPESVFVDSLIPQLIFQTNNGTNMLVAVGGGGGGVRADRTAAAPGNWEIFTTMATAGGPLLSGDRVSLVAADGAHYVQATGGGGSSLRAIGTSVGSFETFTIENTGGGILLNGDRVALRAANGSYVVAENGGGGTVSVSSATRGANSTFTVRFVTPHITDLVSKSGTPGRRNPR